MFLLLTWFITLRTNITEPRMNLRLFAGIIPSYCYSWYSFNDYFKLLEGSSRRRSKTNVRPSDFSLEFIKSNSLYHPSRNKNKIGHRKRNFSGIEGLIRRIYTFSCFKLYEKFTWNVVGVVGLGVGCPLIVKRLHLGVFNERNSVRSRELKTDSYGNMFKVIKNKK